MHVAHIYVACTECYCFPSLAYVRNQPSSVQDLLFSPAIEYPARVLWSSHVQALLSACFAKPLPHAPKTKQPLRSARVLLCVTCSFFSEVNFAVVAGAAVPCILRFRPLQLRTCCAGRSALPLRPRLQLRPCRMCPHFWIR